MNPSWTHHGKHHEHAKVRPWVHHEANGHTMYTHTPWTERGGTIDSTMEVPWCIYSTVEAPWIRHGGTTETRWWAYGVTGDTILLLLGEETAGW